MQGLPLAAAPAGMAADAAEEVEVLKKHLLTFGAAAYQANSAAQETDALLRHAISRVRLPACDDAVLALQAAPGGLPAKCLRLSVSGPCPAASTGAPRS
jgi:hypothetical protein